MSFKSKMLAGAAALALVGGLGTAGTLSASAATPSCGPGFFDPATGIISGCVNVFSRQFGTHRSPNFVVDVFRQGAKLGQPIILFRTSNSDPAEDFTVALQGTVSDFALAGLVSAAVNLHYGDMPAYELEYAPFGVESGLCMGLATTAIAGEGVTLQPCGVSAKTIWIDDTADSPATFDRGYDPVINGSTTNFSHPHVLSYPKNGFPTDIPRPQLRVQNLTGFSNGSGPIVGTVPDYQLWGVTLGVLR
jgi:hypothetical protein